MQYANVRVKRKTSVSRSFLYAIPPLLLPEIKIGQLVMVPFQRKKILGVVESLTKKTPANVTPLEILSIYSQTPIISHTAIKYYGKVAKQTLSSFEDVLFYFLPPKSSNISCPSVKDRPSSSKGTIVAKYFDLRGRFKLYKQLILKKDRPTYILFGDKNTLASFSKYISDIDHVVFSSEDSAKVRWKKWEEIHRSSIVLGTRQLIGVVNSKKSLFIIDEPIHPGHKEERRPKFTTEQLILLRQEMGDDILIGSSSGSLHTFYLTGKIPSFLVPKPLLTTVNKKTILPSSTLRRISESGSTLIALPKKGEWHSIYCKNCYKAAKCNNCSSALVKVASNKFLCTKCFKSYQTLPACTNCRSFNFVGDRIGIYKLSQILAKYITPTEIQVLEKNTIKPDLSKNVVIATHKIFDYPVPEFSNVIILEFDCLLDIPFFGQEEKIMIDLIRFSKLSKNIEIVTHRPDHRIYHALAQNKISSFFLDLLKERKPAFPPYLRMIKIETEKPLTEINLSKIKNMSSYFSHFKYDQEHSYLITVPKEKWPELYNFYLDNSSKIRFDPEPREV